MNYNHIPPDIMTKFLTGDLSPEERRSAELHLAVCPECAARLDEQRRFEDAAARSYPRTFSGRLDPDQEKAIDEAVRQRLNSPGDSPAWKKRIRGAVAIQLCTVAVVAILLFVMIVAPSGNADGKKEKNSDPVKTENTLAPDKIPVSEATLDKAEKKQPEEAAAVVPGPVVPERKTEAAGPVAPADEKNRVITEEALNPGLIRIFGLNEISLLPPDGEKFRQGVVCMDSPFEPGIRILLAISGSEKHPGLHILPQGKTILRSRLARKGEDNAVSAALIPEKSEDPEFVFVQVVFADASAPAAVSVKDIMSRDSAPAPLRLAAVMHAAGIPRVLLKREIREKMLEELRDLAKNEYAETPGVAGFLEKLEKVK